MASHLIDLDFGSPRIEHMKPFNLENFHLPQFTYHGTKPWAYAMVDITPELGFNQDSGHLEWLALSMWSDQ